VQRVRELKVVEGGRKVEGRENVSLCKVKVRDVGGEGGARKEMGVKEVAARKFNPTLGNTADVYMSEAQVVVNKVVNEGVQSAPKLVRTYRSHPDDLLWACKGVVATVLNGEVIPVIQTALRTLVLMIWISFL
jgi:hypothetical protein